MAQSAKKGNIVEFSHLACREKEILLLIIAHKKVKGAFIKEQLGLSLRSTSKYLSNLRKKGFILSICDIYITREKYYIATEKALKYVN